MSISIMIAAALIAVTGAGQTAADTAQAMPTPPFCPANTQYANIRHSRIKPDRMATFDKAVAAHRAWYAERKIALTITVVRVLKQQGAEPAVVPDEMVTVTRYGGPPLPPDDAWRAFLALYADSSEILHEVRTCMPAG